MLWKERLVAAAGKKILSKQDLKIEEVENMTNIRFGIMALITYSFKHKQAQTY